MKKDGSAFGGAKFEDRNGKSEGGMPRMIDPAAKASKLAKKKTSDGFKRGGATKPESESTDEDNITRVPDDEDDGGRKRGGATKKKKEGGKVEGEAPMETLAKRARGGRTSAPFSSAKGTSARHARTDSGHEGE